VVQQLVAGHAECHLRDVVVRELRLLDEEHIRLGTLQPALDGFESSLE